MTPKPINAKTPSVLHVEGLERPFDVEDDKYIPCFFQLFRPEFRICPAYKGYNSQYNPASTGNRLLRRS